MHCTVFGKHISEVKLGNTPTLQGLNTPFLRPTSLPLMPNPVSVYRVPHFQVAVGLQLVQGADQEAAEQGTSRARSTSGGGRERVAEGDVLQGPAAGTPARQGLGPVSGDSTRERYPGDLWSSPALRDTDTT